MVRGKCEGVKRCCKLDSLGEWGCWNSPSLRPAQRERRRNWRRRTRRLRRGGLCKQGAAAPYQNRYRSESTCVAGLCCLYTADVGTYAEPVRAIILAAGYGARFLPATKVLPKELLPLIDRPTIAFVVDELVRSGIEDILIIGSRRKRALEDYFDREPELERLFEGDRQMLGHIAPPEVRVQVVRQQVMRGTGHALLLGEQFAQGEPVIVVYPDDLHFGEPPLTARLIDVWRESGCAVLATVSSPPNLNRYGVVRLAADGRHVETIVEKPAPGDEPSQEASIGRFLLTPDFFGYLREGWEVRTAHGAVSAPQEEYYHIYALQKLMDTGRVVHCSIRDGWQSVGEPGDYLRAIVRYAARHPRYAAILTEELERLQGLGEH